MRLIRSLMAAFSMYSRIPVLHFRWNGEDEKYMLCFFPWVGAVIGVALYFWCCICEALSVGNLCRTLIGTAIPLIITGGFHMDGFLDTMDAFHSYQPRERKLEILKDSHIGAFAVIMCCVMGLLYMGAFSEVEDEDLLRIVCAGFFLARCLSGIGVVTFPLARKEGLLYHFSDSAEKRIVKRALIGQGILCVVFMLWQNLCAGIFIVAAAFCAFGYYYVRSKREFGGITGDTAGYFMVLGECSMMLVAAMVNCFRNGGAG